jgi:methylated-DNA-[protein]-cysteine S-methyltransferase
MNRKEMLSILSENGLTRFQKDVLMETLSIPKGKTATYKEIAAKVGKPGAYRAVGTALKKNPLPIVIPCHRVIKTNGELGNYSGGGTKRKKELLKSEHAIL